MGFSKLPNLIKMNLEVANMSTFKEKLETAWGAVKKGLSKVGEFVVEHKEAFYYVGGFVFGCIAGKIVTKDEYADDIGRMHELEQFEPSIDVAKRFVGEGATTMCNWHIAEVRQRKLGDMLGDMLEAPNVDEMFPGHADDTVVGITFHTKEGGDSE